MKRAITILTVVMLLGSCTMTEVNTDQEEMQVSDSGPQTGPAKGIVIIPSKK